MALSITSFQPSTAADAELAAHYDLFIAITAHDLPERHIPPYEQIIDGLVRADHGDEREIRIWQAHLDGELVGAVTATFVNLDHLAHTAFVDLRVRPEHRRRGIGSQLLNEALQEARARGRETVNATVVEGRDNDAFARALGFRFVWHSVFQVLTLATARPERWPRGLADGVRVELWPGPIPDRYIGSYAHLCNEMRDAPAEDSDLVKTDWTPDELRTWERSLASSNIERHVAVAIHDNDEVVGGTSLRIFRARPQQIIQDDTVVRATHRGRGIATAVKAANLTWILEHRAASVEVTTFVARTNEAMLRVNRRLGFADLFQNIDVQARIDDLVHRQFGRVAGCRASGQT